MDKLYDHQRCEKEVRDLWKQENVYGFDKNNQDQVYSIDTPPPTVSGTLHIGHIFSYCHTDFVARYKRMRGHNVFYPMGFDDNGLPTERYVEKKNSTKAHLMPRSEFIALCLKETESVEKVFEDLWCTVGLSVDWSLIYSTISDKARKISQESFIELHKKGLAYRKKEPSLYCTTCRTSVAQAEIDSQEIASNFNDIAFQTEDGKELVIATTRPELLPACVAVFYHPDDARYQDLHGKKALVPLFGRAVPILPDDGVNPEKGTGLVMCCTFGDQHDIEWYKKHKLDVIHVIGLDGLWTQEGGILAGLRVHEARKKVLELLKESEKLLNQKSITHAVNTHERCKQEIEYQILSQWFIPILDHKEALLEYGEKVNWYPSFMKARYRDWVQNLNWDWCISRQRFYGIPFPVWHCTTCNEEILAPHNMLPVDPQETPCPFTTCPQCSSATIVPDTDVMDTWNTSSLTPQINANWPEMNAGITFPMSLRPQAHDIIRTWAFDTIVKAYFHEKMVPWHDIMISGHVLAGKEKISKSKGNEKTTPEALLATYPADVIRFWSASGKLGTDTAFSENQLKIGQKLVTKLWNAFRFCMEHIQGYKKGDRPAELGVLNEWLLHTFSTTTKTYIEHFESYEYSQALEVADRFFWHFFCDNYLEMIKDQFFNPDKYTPEVLEGTRFTLYEIGFGILQLYAPFLPHITEKLYQLLFQSSEITSSLHKTQLNENRYPYEYKNSVCVVNAMLSIINQVRKLKSEHQLSLKTDMTTLAVYVHNHELLKQLEDHRIFISGITRALEIVFSGEAGKTELVKDGEIFTASVVVNNQGI